MHIITALFKMKIYSTGEGCTWELFCEIKCPSCICEHHIIILIFSLFYSPLLKFLLCFRMYGPNHIITSLLINYVSHIPCLLPMSGYCSPHRSIILLL